VPRDDADGFFSIPQKIVSFSADCSCWNSNVSFGCCERYLHRTHKMGVMLTKKLFAGRRTNRTTSADILLTSPHGNAMSGRDLTIFDHSSYTDYREVILFRNIYESLISGYLYHSTGRECWLDAQGKRRTAAAIARSDSVPWKANWQHYVAYGKLDPPRGGNNRSLCQYLADESVNAGMKAYIGWVFPVKYRELFTRWAMMFSTWSKYPSLSHQALLRNKTLVVCYEDLTSPSKDLETLQRMFRFWFGDNNHHPYAGLLAEKDIWRSSPGQTEYRGAHSSARDPQLRKNLKEVIQKLDADFFDGEIAWLHSVFPC